MKDRKNSIKVLQLIQEISDGGAETLVKEYAIHINRNVFDMYILTELTSDNSSSAYLRLRDTSIPIYCPFINGNNRFFSKVIRKIQRIIIRKISSDLLTKYTFCYIRKKIRKLDPDVIHVHLKMLKYLTPFADELKGKKLFYTCHSLPNRYFNQDECLEDYYAAKVLIQKCGLVLIGLHQQMAEELNRIFGINNTIVLNNGIDISRIRNVIDDKDAIRKSLGIPESAFVVGHIGRFAYMKNHHFLVEVFNEVVKRKDNAFLLMVGAGDGSSTRELLEKYDLSDRYILLSNRDDIPQILKSMDAFVFPSLFEGLSLACIEAQAAGLRCVISDSLALDTFCCENAIMANLCESYGIWAEKVLNDGIKGNRYNEIENYDIHKVIIRLEKLYNS